MHVKNTRLAFINPPFKNEFGRFSRESRSPSITKSGTLYYPLWLLYAAAVTEEDGFPVCFIDAPAKNWNIEKIIKELEDFSPDLIVLNTSTPSINNDIQLARLIKEKIKMEPLIIAVGTHPTAEPFSVLSAIQGGIDLVARGEYDYTIRELGNILESGQNPRTINGISFLKQSGEIQNNPERPFIEDLNSLPFISKFVKRHLNVRDYFFAASRYPVIQIISGRGCPNRCFFCVYPQVMHGRKYRARSARNLFEEFQFIKKELPEVKEIGIEDDTFTVDESRVLEFCKLLEEQNLKIPWYCNARASLSYETMLKMKRAGCKLLIVGYESGDQTILNNIKKGTTVRQNLDFSNNAKKAGLLVHGCFMLGNPGETRETINTTLSLAMELKDDTVQFFPLIPYPGTEAYNWALQSRLLTNRNFAKWVKEDGTMNTVICAPGISSEELVKFCNEARKKYYLRPKYFCKKLLQSIINPNEFVRNYKAFMSLRKHLR